MTPPQAQPWAGFSLIESAIIPGRVDDGTDALRTATFNFALANSR